MNRLPKTPKSTPDFTPPSSQAEKITRRLHEVILQRIDRGDGFLSFDEYMDLALYAPGAGYYVAGQVKFGTDGDFVTAPEIGDLFGRCLARQCAEILERTGGDIVEFGAGSGALAAQLLNHVSTLPENYIIIETSPDLIARQRETISSLAAEMLERVQWLSELPAEITGVVVANEVLDAMPVARFVVEDNGIYELGVGSEDSLLVNRLRIDGPESLDLERRFASLGLATGYRSEYGPRAEAWMATIADILKCGVLLAIDYGFSASEYYSPIRATGTLRCHYRHRAHDDPFLWPGLQDITAHVDFSAMAGAGLDNTLELGGYTSLANFLMGLGLVDLVTDQSTTDEMQGIQQNRQLTRLTSPLAMGEIFKVLAMTRDFHAPLSGFAQRDQRHQLFQPQS